MSDIPQRRHGTDFDTLRGLGTESSRGARAAEDPLAELARLVSQTPPSSQSFAVTGEPRASFNTQPEPRSFRTDPPMQTPAAPPPQPRASFAVPQDRFEPSVFGGEQRPYGAPSQPDYDPNNDFFADDPPPLRGGYDAYGRDDEDTGDDDPFAAGFQARGAYHDDFDDDPRTANMYPGEDEDAHDDMPVGRRRGNLLMGVALSLLLIGALGAWAYTSLGTGSSGEPPVIKAQNEQIKIVPDAKKVSEPSKQFYDRVGDDAETAKVVAPEEPREKPARVILPGAPAEGGAEMRIAEASAAPSVEAPRLAPQEPAATDEPTSGNARIVKTIPIRPDGMPATPPSDPYASQPAALSDPPAPSGPIQGSGAGEGMSMEPGPAGGIMAGETSGPAPMESSAAAYAPTPPAPESVPLPQPRPLMAQAASPAAPAPSAAQARAATQGPATTASIGGPPSSPQPQVTVTNKRALSPQGGVPAAAPRAAAPVPAGAQQPRPAQPATQPQRPQQLAAASASPAPAATRLPAPQAPAAPQIATVASSGRPGSYSVQLASLPTEAEARNTYAALQQRYPQYLGGLPVTLQQATLPNGTFYRVRVAQPTQEAAANLCISIKNAGGQCIVQKN